ncbi:MAG TPA: serine hydrolase [Thermoanaerobaculia bacterium]|nr:serine hydrolase [Thermoanaerobaculia bacterium]
MRRRPLAPNRTLFTWSVFLLCAAAAHANGTPAAPSGLTPEVDAYLSKALADWQIPGMAVAVVRPDRVVFAKGYGVRELGKPEPVDEHTVFDAASLTKSFTGTLAAILVEEGKLAWDDPVHKHLPGLRFPDAYLDEHLTVRDLLAHRTGLHPANMMWVLTDVDRAEVLRRARCLPATAGLRADMVYSNVGYSIAGEALAAAGGASWERLVRERLLEPLGLRDTTASYEEAGRLANRATSHTLIDGVQRPIRRETQRHSIAAAGDVQSSAHDLARWLRLHLNGGTLDGKRLVGEEALRDIQSPQAIIATTPAMRAARQVEFFAAYGLGWQVMDYRGRPLLWHTGSGNGQIAFAALLPKDGLGVVVLVNTWAAPFVHAALVNYLLDAYLGETPRDWSAEGLARVPGILAEERKQREKTMEGTGEGTVPARPFAAYAGTYDDCLYGPIHVRAAAGDGLELQMGGGQTADLLPAGGDVFVVRWRDPFYRETRLARVTFEPAPDGTAARLAMDLGRDAIRAVRKSTKE